MGTEIIFYGAAVERSDDGVTYDRIPKVKSVAIPEVETDYLDATSLDSPDGFKEYVKGMKDAGTPTMSVGYTADGYEQQLTDQASATAIYYRVTLEAQSDQSSGDVFEFQAFPTPRLTSNSVQELVGMEVTLRTTGGVNWTRGAAAV